MKLKQAWGLFAVTAALTMTGCQSQTNNTQNSEPEIIKVQAAEVRLSEVEMPGTLTATVEAAVSNHLSPQSSGRLTRIYVEVGDQGARGQQLAEMDAVNLVQTRTKEENSKLEFDPTEELY